MCFLSTSVWKLIEEMKTTKTVLPDAATYTLWMTVAARGRQSTDQYQTSKRQVDVQGAFEVTASQ